MNIAQDHTKWQMLILAQINANRILGTNINETNRLRDLVGGTVYSGVIEMMCKNANRNLLRQQSSGWLL
jgi:hypothetical protein